MFLSAEQVDLEKYPPVCVEPDEQSESGSSGQVIGHQVIGEQLDKLKTSPSASLSEGLGLQE